MKIEIEEKKESTNHGFFSMKKEFIGSL